MAIGSMTTNSTVDLIDKTLKTENAPADAKAVGDIILDRTKETPQPIFYSKAEVDKMLEDCKEAAKRAALLAANPVGKLWASDDPTSPASIVGGTWERIAQDRALMGASDTHSAGTTAEAGLPNITGSIFLRPASHANESVHSGIVWDDSNGALSSIIDPEDNDKSGPVLLNDNVNYMFPHSAIRIDASKSNSIYGKSATVQPPAYYAYIWRRIA